MTLEEKVVAEIKEILQRNNCVLTSSTEFYTLSMEEIVTVRVKDVKDPKSGGTVLYKN